MCSYQPGTAGAVTPCVHPNRQVTEEGEEEICAGEGRKRRLRGVRYNLMEIGFFSGAFCASCHQFNKNISVSVVSVVITSM